MTCASVENWVFFTLFRATRSQVCYNLSARNPSAQLEGEEKEGGLGLLRVHENKMMYSVPALQPSRLQPFWERLLEKVHATIRKDIVGGFEFTLLQRNLKESHEPNGRMFASAKGKQQK